MRLVLAVLTVMLGLAAPAWGLADHTYWPTTEQIRACGGLFLMQKIPPDADAIMLGTHCPDRLLGHHGSDILKGYGSRDVLWGDYDGTNQPTTQTDQLYGGPDTDFLYASHGRNFMLGGRGNDVVYARFGRGGVDCGPGRDIVSISRTLKRARAYRFLRCERFEYRSEAELGHGVAPLP